MLLITSSWIYILFSHCFFFYNARKSCAPSWKFSFLMINSSIEISFYVIPTPTHPHPNTKIPLQTQVHFIITIIVCKQYSKFVTCSPSPGTVGGEVVPKTQYVRFSTKRNRMANSKFWFGDFGENIRVRWPRRPPIFLSLKKGIRTFNFR